MSWDDLKHNAEVPPYIWRHYCRYFDIKCQQDHKPNLLAFINKCLRQVRCIPPAIVSGKLLKDYTICNMAVNRNPDVLKLIPNANKSPGLLRVKQQGSLLKKLNPDFHLDKDIVSAFLRRSPEIFPDITEKLRCDFKWVS